MRNFKVFITLNVPQKCSVKYYTNAEKLKISKKIVQSVEHSPRPEKETFCKSLKLFLGYFKPFLFSQTFSKFLYICGTAFNVAFIENILNVIIAFKISQTISLGYLERKSISSYQNCFNCGCQNVLRKIHNHLFELHN